MVKSLWLQKKYDLLLVKLFDRLHNIQTISVKSPEKIHKILEETNKYFFSPCGIP
jgi:(p)ppGpp synthase/HD superfamily hydrolase